MIAARVGRVRLADDEEDRDREDEEEHGRQPEPVRDRDVEQEDQQPDEDRPAVADRRPDPRQLAARRRVGLTVLSVAS